MTTGNEQKYTDGAGWPEVVIRAMQTAADRVAFQTLNEEWMTLHFTIEAKGRERLNDPEGTILGKGGRVFMVNVDGAAMGCVR